MKNLVIIFGMVLTLFTSAVNANEVFLKELFLPFVGKYEISNCTDNMIAFKNGTSINFMLSSSYKSEGGIVFHLGGVANDGNGYVFEDFENHISIDHQKMKHGCLKSDDEWSVGNNVIQAKTHTKWFDKYFCKLENDSLEEFTELQLMVADASSLQLNYSQIVGAKVIQDGSCQLKRVGNAD